MSALESLCSAWQERSGVRCRCSHGDGLDELGEAVDTTVYRVVQEAFSNVMRHAHARHVEVGIAVAGSRLSVVVEDDGRGIDPSRGTRGLGLLGAGERAAGLGGELRVEKAPGGGTRLSLFLPLLAANAA